jgi:hypothetical protein
VLPGRPHHLSVALPRAACGPLGALQELSSAATSLLFSYSVVAFFRCCVLSTTAFLLLSSYPLPLRVVCEISLVCARSPDLAALILSSSHGPCPLPHFFYSFIFHFQATPRYL